MIGIFFSACGIAGESTGVKRIIGGSAASQGEHPWTVKLSIRTKDNLGYQCGGSILNSHNIMTAAHCLGDPSR